MRGRTRFIFALILMGLTAIVASSSCTGAGTQPAKSARSVAPLDGSGLAGASRLVPEDAANKINRLEADLKSGAIKLQEFADTP